MNAPRWTWRPIDGLARAGILAIDGTFQALLWIDRHQTPVGGGVLGAALILDTAALAVAGATIAIAGQIRREGAAIRRLMSRAGASGSALPMPCPMTRRAPGDAPRDDDIAARHRHNEGRMQ